MYGIELLNEHHSPIDRQNSEAVSLIDALKSAHARVLESPAYSAVRFIRILDAGGVALEVHPISR